MQEKENVTENFEISFLSGIIQITKAPDYEKTQFFRFSVEASDNDGLESTANVIVYVEDVNDNAPMFLETSAHVTIPESISDSFILHTVEAVDNDFDDNRKNNPNNFIQYSITDGNDDNVFNIDRYKGISPINTISLRKGCIKLYILYIFFYMLFLFL